MIAHAHNGRIHPLTGQPLGTRKQPSRITQDDFNRKRSEVIKAGYDAASDSNEFSKYWANADALDADSANSRAVRSKLVKRSRYEVSNNGFTDGMVQTHANYLVGTGPSLRMQTQSSGFNSLIEAEWKRWTKAVMLRRKLWCMAHAKVQDGEGFAIIRNNPKVKHAVKLDLVLIEAEQCQTPMLPYATAGYIDGIKFDEFGNPEWYDILQYHPGGNTFSTFSAIYGEAEQVPAKFVLHWFMLRRPGQHRGIPELTSTLQVGASSRRWREATVAAAETAADISVLLETAFTPNEVEEVAPMSTIEFNKRMMTALPAGWKGGQMDAKHPNATYETFHQAQINEQGRPKNMPLNIAKCDSSRYNYASGRLDHQTYFGSIDVEREDGSDLVLDPLFDLWFEEAALAYGWNATPSRTPAHAWDWPKHPVADIESEANAIDKRLRNGTISLSKAYADDGEDFEDDIQVIANDYGISVEEAKRMLRTAILNASGQQASLMTAENQAEVSNANE